MEVCKMSGVKKLEAPVTLFAAIEEKQHEALRELAFREHRSLADVVRDAIELYLKHEGRVEKKPARV
jgi:hypothetical protein